MTGVQKSMLSRRSLNYVDLNSGVQSTQIFPNSSVLWDFPRKNVSFYDREFTLGLSINYVSMPEGGRGLQNAHGCSRWGGGCI